MKDNMPQQHPSQCCCHMGDAPQPRLLHHLQGFHTPLSHSPEFLTGAVNGLSPSPGHPKSHPLEFPALAGNQHIFPVFKPNKARLV